MNQSQLLGLVRRYIKEVGQADMKRVRFTPDYAARKAEYDGALKALALLEALAYQRQEQPTLGGNHDATQG